MISQSTVQAEETRSPETDNVTSQQFLASPLTKTHGPHAQSSQQA